MVHNYQIGEWCPTVEIDLLKGGGGGHSVTSVHVISPFDINYFMTPVVVIGNDDGA